MLAGRSGSAERLRDLVSWVASWTWPLPEADSVALAEAYGWSITDNDSGKGAVYETGLLSDRSWASVRLLDGDVRQVKVFTSVVVGGRSPEDQRFVTDTFADQVRVVAAVLGAPAEVTPGQDGAATWDLPNGSELEVRRTDRSCSWTIASPCYAQLKRDVRRIGG